MGFGNDVAAVVCEDELSDCRESFSISLERFTMESMADWESFSKRCSIPIFVAMAKKKHMTDHPARIVEGLSRRANDRSAHS